MSDTLHEFEASFDRALKEKYPRSFELVHWMPDPNSDDRRFRCCLKTSDQVPGAKTITADPNKVTCRPWGYDLNKAWQWLTDELEAARCR